MHAGCRRIGKIASGAFCYSKVEGESEMHLPYVKFDTEHN